MNSSVLLLSATPRNDKLGWYHQFQKCNVLLSNSKAKTLIVSDSLVSNVSRYPEIWRKPFINNGTFIFDIPGDKVKNVLPRVNNLHFWSNLNFFFFLFFTALLLILLIHYNPRTLILQLLLKCFLPTHFWNRKILSFH